MLLNRVLAGYNHFAHTYFPRAPHVGSCSGKEYAAWAGIAVLTSYLFLFIA